MVGSGRTLTPVDDPHGGEKLGSQKGGIEGNGVRGRDSRLDVSGATVMDGEEERQEARLNVVFGIERDFCLRQQGSAVADSTSLRLSVCNSHAIMISIPR